MKKKVIFIIPSLSGGGAEHMLTVLLSRLNRDKISPVLIAYNKKGVYLEQLPPDIVTYDFRCDAYQPGFKWKIPFIFQDNSSIHERKSDRYNFQICRMSPRR